MSMVEARMAVRFWAAVQDCLVTFHHQPPAQAAQAVVDLWRRLHGAEEQPHLADMIYHAEPWSIACNLAEQPDLSLATDQTAAYRKILEKNGLA